MDFGMCLKDQSAGFRRFAGSSWLAIDFWLASFEIKMPDGRVLSNSLSPAGARPGSKHPT
jgi:hypothetical protein